MKEKISDFKNRFYINGHYNIYALLSLILICFSVVLLLIAYLTDRNDFTTAVLIAVSFANFLAAVIIAGFSRSGGINSDISSMLYPSHSTELAKMLSLLKVFGDAHFIPKSASEEPYTLQFNPPGEYQGFSWNNKMFSMEDEETAGFFSRPSSYSLMKMLYKKAGLFIPDYDDSNETKYYGDFNPKQTDVFSEILKEVLCEYSSFCDEVKVSSNSDELIITLKNFSLISGCSEVREESLKCCTVAPCPVCSLVASLTAEYFNSVVSFSAVWPDYKSGDLNIILKALSHQPRDEDRDSLH